MSILTAVIWVYLGLCAVLFVLLAVNEVRVRRAMRQEQEVALAIVELLLRRGQVHQDKILATIEAPQELTRFVLRELHQHREVETVGGPMTWRIAPEAEMTLEGVV